MAVDCKPYLNVVENELARLEALNSSLQKKVKTLNQKVRRRDSRLNTITQVVADLKRERLLDHEPAAVMEKCFDGTVLELVKNELCNSDRKPQGKRYSQEVKRFATTLHYYSPQAYEHCRKTFSLPDVASIRNWLSNIDCEAGFLTNVIDLIAKSDSKDFSLVIDAMSIKKHTSYLNGKYSGCVDYGGIIAEDTDRLCTEALVFLLVPLSFSMTKYPVGYFLVDKVNANVQCQLVQSILHLTAAQGIKIRNITCDGAAANQAMFSQLGASLDVMNPKPYFQHPNMDHKVYTTLDICHMIKLSRNALADYKSFHVANTEERICWQYIVDLADKQTHLGLHLANKLSARHINWRKQKMKVKLAAQTFSRYASQCC